MKSTFQTIGLIGRKDSDQVVESLLTLLSFFEQKNCRVLLEKETALMVPNHAVEIAEVEELANQCQLAIVVGGDGSMLGVAQVLSEKDIPVLGVNRGSLGFLTDISPGEIEARVTEVLDGKYNLEERFLLDVNLVRNNKEEMHSCALNEVVIHRGSSLRMIEFSLYIDEQFVCSYHSDGLIVSTPTGSTAYALSGGGPIVHPSLNAVALVPMFPHTLSGRPIVIDAKSEIKIVMGEPRGGRPELSCDGQSHFPIDSADIILIRKKTETLSLIHPLNHNYYETCRTKLGWGGRLA